MKNNIAQHIARLFALIALMTILPGVTREAFATTNTSASYIEKGNYIYFGTSGQKWRVLDDEKTNMGTDGIFLFSENSLGTASKGPTGQDYATNGLKTWCTNYLNNNFTAAEKAAMIETTVAKSTGTYANDSNCTNYPLNKDKLFLLSGAEAMNSNYFSDDSSRKLSHATNYGTWWFLRTSSTTALGQFLYVKTYGGLSLGNIHEDGDSGTDYSYRPGFNLDTSKVLFYTATSKDVGLTSDVNGTDTRWKLTLKDNNSFATGASVNMTTLCPNQEITVYHRALSAISSDYTNVTAAVFSGDTMLCYGSVNDDTSATSSTFQIPADRLQVGSTYTLKLYGEDWNGDYYTDMATGTPYSVDFTLRAHEGGTATCLNLAVCEVCNASYGPNNYDNHEGIFYSVQTGTTNICEEICDCGHHSIAVLDTAQAEYTYKPNSVTLPGRIQYRDNWLGYKYYDIQHENHIEPGTATITLTLRQLGPGYDNSNPQIVTLTYNYTITPLDISTCSVFGYPDVYTGDALSVAVFLGDHKLTEGQDYNITITSPPQTEAGKYYCAIDGTGNYNGSILQQLTIAPANLTNVSVTAEEMTDSSVTQIPVVTTTATSVNNQPVTFTYSIAEDGTYSEQLPTITDVGEHTIYFKASAPNHNDVKGTFTVKVTHVCGNGAPQDGQSATCVVDGWKDYYKCSCGKFYADAACTAEITDLEAWKIGDGKIPAAHEISEEYVNNDPDAHWKTCKNCPETINRTAHEYEDAQDSNCNVCGYTRKLYTATWIINGTQVAQYQVAEGAIIPMPQNVQVPDDYTYYKWDGDNWTDNQADYMPSGDLTVTGKWTAKVTLFDREGNPMTFANDATYNLVIVGDELTLNYRGDKNYIDGYNLYMVDMSDTSKKYPITYESGNAIYPSVTITKNTQFQLVAEKIIITAPYTIHAFTMDVSGDYGTAEITTSTGTVGELATITPESKTGFTVDTNASELAGTVVEDGSLTLKIYYSRNQYTFTTIVDSVESSVKYYYGASVTITANTPETGKQFAGWTGLDGLNITSGSTTTESVTFTMPAKAVAVEATYEDVPVATYSVTVTNGSGSGNYTAGASVTITANAPATGKQFAGWKSDDVTFADANAATTTFTMPAKAVTVTATYEDIPAGNITGVTISPNAVTVKPGDTVQFTAKVEGTGNFDADVIWSLLSYGGNTLSVNTNIDANGLLTVGTDETLTEFYVEAGAKGDTSQYARATVTVEKPTQPTYTVSFDANSGSGTMTPVSGVSGSYTLPTCSFTAPSGKHFKGWALTATGEVIATATIDVTANTTLYAIWETDTYSVTVTNGSGSGNYTAGASVTITANAPAAGKQFAGWTTQDGVTFADANAATTTFTMPAKAVAVTATYEDIPAATYSVTVTNGSGSGDYAEGATVTITANAPATGKQFAGWMSDDVTFADASKATTTFTMPAKAVTVTANYEDIPAATYSVTVTNSSGSGDYAEGASVTITADAPATGKQFAGWMSDDVTFADANAATTTFTMPAKAVAVTANYTDLPVAVHYTVVYNANGGTGTMANQYFNYGETKALLANAFIREGYTFSGWNTRPDGTGTAYADGQNVTLYGAVILYAQWTTAATPDVPVSTPVPTSVPTPVPTPEPVVTPLEIIQQPTDQMVAPRETATFSIAATGDGLTYQWYINRNDGRGWVKLQGATSAVHVTAAADLAYDGFQYLCEVRDTHGNEVRSAIAVLYVAPTPDIPETGDATNLPLLSALLLLSLAGCVLLVSCKRRFN